MIERPLPFARLWALAIVVAVCGPEALRAQSDANQPVQMGWTSAELPASEPPSGRLPSGQAEDLATHWFGPEGFSSTFRLFLLLSVLSLAPALVLMTTSFVRFSVVLYLLRQALGMQQLPPNQVVAALAVFLTALVMAPIWREMHAEAIRPYTQREISGEEAWQRGTEPLKRFMSAQIERAGDSDDVWLFLQYLPEQPEPETYEQVPLEALAPAFLLSELKTAFLIGFRIYLPFLVIDLVVAAVLTGMGMFMLPPSFVSIPFKLLLFVLADGWHLVVGALLEGIVTPG